MKLEYPLDKFIKVREEVLNNWKSIGDEFIFWTPPTSNIIGYDLFNWKDDRFEYTYDLINQIKKNKLVHSIIMYVYNPFSRTAFHFDISSFRYVFPIVSNEMCFNYEMKNKETTEELNQL